MLANTRNSSVSSLWPTFLVSSIMPVVPSGLNSLNVSRTFSGGMKATATRTPEYPLLEACGCKREETLFAHQKQRTILWWRILRCGYTNSKSYRCTKRECATSRPG
ncbi:hypothetical protein BJX76DRAFT_92182 [Aspergillus varians]